MRTAVHGRPELLREAAASLFANAVSKGALPVMNREDAHMWAEDAYANICAIAVAARLCNITAHDAVLVFDDRATPTYKQTFPYIDHVNLGDVQIYGTREANAVTAVSGHSSTLLNIHTALHQPITRVRAMISHRQQAA